ncbi:MAG: DUF531 domain-containing protein [Methanosarcinaceae archaeon]|nr:DUF531 domain-containing protein [Methanosarcinaceae archaeon]
MLTLGIVNMYDKIKIVDAHYRAIARAAPICYAFGFSLALYDFPFKMTVDELVEFVRDQTTIGESGRFLDLLNKEHHLYVADLPPKGFPAHFGSIVVTTSKPYPQKLLTPLDVADGNMKKRSYMFLVGLGRKGLPKDLFERAEYHLDITEKRISLETCTAIGAIPTQINALTFALEQSRRYGLTKEYLKNARQEQLQEQDRSGKSEKQDL